MKEQYISRAVEVQPCFNRDVISDLSDQATTTLLDIAAWADGDGVSYDESSSEREVTQRQAPEHTDVESEILKELMSGDVLALRQFITRLGTSALAQRLLSKVFLSAVNTASEEALTELLATDLVDLGYQDEINARNCLHKAAISGRSFVLRICLERQLDVTSVDAYGRIPLHYACMHGHVDFVRNLIHASPSSIEVRDLDNFTALIHAITHSQLHCVGELLSLGANIDPSGSNDYIPLNLACQHGSLPIVELILHRKPRILPDAEGLYPQHLVARSGESSKMLLLLKQYGADLDQPDKLYQWTPLFHAASEGHLDCLKVLLDCGVNADILDEKGLSALYYASWEGHTECMKLLARVGRNIGKSSAGVQTQATAAVSNGNTPQRGEPEGIPDLSLPPPIIPTRRYGHNFLESKTLVVINFEGEGSESVRFYDRGKYPAARLTVVPRPSEILFRDLLLPLQDESKIVSFEIENRNIFAIDFEIFPTFGKKILAKGSVPAEVFGETSDNGGQYYCPLLDPRLKCIGQISFKFQVIKPFPGIPLEITPYATYWKATSQFESQPRALVTGSSLSGEYVRLFVQLTRDGVPVLYPRWTITMLSSHDDQGIELPISSLSLGQFQGLCQQDSQPPSIQTLPSIAQYDISRLHRDLAMSHSTLAEVLSILPADLSLELHILYPTADEERRGSGLTVNINDCVDAILTTVFEHARHLRQQYGDAVRSIVFSSFNQDICTTLNWKQPNCKHCISITG